MKRLHISLNIEFGNVAERPPEREAQLDAYVERPHPDDVSERAELDRRRRIGFAPPEDT